MSRTSADIRDWLLAWLGVHLGLDARTIDSREAFSRLGLSSLQATGLVSELAAELGRTVSPLAVWEHPNVEALAAHLASPGSPASALPAPSTRLAAAEPVALVGMACRFPGAADPRAFWELLCEGRDAVGEVPAGRWDADAYYHPDPAHPGTMNTRAGGFLERIDEFDPLFFRISPREAVQMDPQQRLMLELAWEALEDAGLPAGRLHGTPAGVFFGALWGDYADLHRERRAPVTLHTGPGQALNIIANRVSYVFGLRGPSLVVDTACSSTLVAVHLACRSLRDGESEVALVGGVNLMISPETTVRVCKYGGLSGDGRCKTFDRRADGFGRGEGAGVVVLKPLSRALADGDRVYCLIRGSAVNNDGASNGLTAPSPQAQEEVLRRAYRDAALRPEEVGYVELHGTGTEVGDPIEARALSAVLCAERPAERPLVVGSAKTNLAHLESAAGAAGLVKTALAVHHRFLPPSLHCEDVHPMIPLGELKLRLQRTPAPWPDAGPARAGVSAFGWGGTNAHVVLEELPAAPVRPARAPAVAATPVVFVASPLGAQWCGMGRELTAREPVYRTFLERCCRLFDELDGGTIFDELTRAQEGPRWEDWPYAAAVTFSHDMAMAALWRSWGVTPGAVVGHSLGEVTAACVAGVLSLAEGAALVHIYGRLASRLNGTGMGVVGLPAGEAEKRIEGRAGIWVAGENSPRTTLVGGERGTVDRLLSELPPGVYKARVRISATTHCPLVDPLLDELREGLRGLRPRAASVPMVSSVTAAPVAGPEMDAEHWARHLGGPVRFAGAVEHLLRQGHRSFLQLGPHPVLGHVLGESFEALGAGGRALASMHQRQETREVLLGTLGVLGEAPAPETPPPGAPELVVLSAHTEDALRERAWAVAAQLRETPAEDAPPLADLAYTAACRRDHQEYRLAFAAASVEQVVVDLESWLGGGEVPALALGRARGTPPPVAFVYSGQAPQWWWAMGRELTGRVPAFDEALERCGDALSRHADLSLREVFSAPAQASVMQRPAVAQPVLFAIQAALTEVWRSWGVTPAVVLGHSFGEVAAAYAAGVLDLGDAARVAAERGRAMEPLQGTGTMATVELPAAEAEELCRPYGERLRVASYNAPATVVLSGEREAVAEAVETVTARGAGAWELRVKLPFHGPGMEEAGRRLEAALAGLRPREGRCPLVSTVTGALLAGKAMDEAYWRRNVCRPVRFAAAVEAAAGTPCRTFLEIGTQPLLASAVHQCLEALGEASPTVLISMRAGREHATLLEALGGLYVRGVPVSWPGAYPRGGRLVPLPSYPFQRRSYWLPENGVPAAEPKPQAAVPQPEPAGELEEVFAGQLRAFNRLVARQMELLK